MPGQYLDGRPDNARYHRTIKLCKMCKIIGNDSWHLLNCFLWVELWIE